MIIRINVTVTATTTEEEVKLINKQLHEIYPDSSVRIVKGSIPEEKVEFKETRFCDKCGIKFTTKDPKKWKCSECLANDKTELNKDSHASEVKPEVKRKTRSRKQAIKTRACDECGTIFSTVEEGQLRCQKCFSKYMKIYSGKNNIPCDRCGFAKDSCMCGKSRGRRRKGEEEKENNHSQYDAYYEEPYNSYL